MDGSAGRARRRSVYTHQQLRRLIDPRSVAIVGLSRKEGSFGARTALNLSHFTGGRVFGVNPNADELHGLACYPSLSAIPEPVDCVVIAVPFDAVEAVLEDCAAAGVGGAIIYASGFAETGLDERIRLQQRLAAIGRESGVRIVGPNCIGLINNVTRAGLCFSSSYGHRPGESGPVGLVSQSGGLGQSVAQVTERGGAFSHFLAAGNSCDVDVCDYVSFLAGDEVCRSIICIAEGLSDGERFLEAGEAARAADKPIVMYKVATGQASARAAMSHTGAIAGANAAYDAAYRRLGVVRIDNIEEAYEAASFLAKAGRPRAEGVAAVAASGGACIIALDKAEAAGVSLPKPSPATQSILDANVPDFGAPGNPCDITAQVATNPDSYAACAGALLADPAYGALVVMAPSINPVATPRNVAMFARLGAEAGKPVCLSWMSQWLSGPGAAEAEASPHVALFQSTERCFRVLAAWQARERTLCGPPPRPRDGAESAAAPAARAPLAAAGDRLSEREAKAVLDAYGIAVASDEVVHDAEAAALAAARIGFPVVLKVESADIAHKTEAGVVRLGLGDAAAVRTAYAEVMAAAQALEPKPRIAGVLVQPMIPAGIELVVGAHNDPTFGPMVVVGLGGVMVELLKDSTSELAPVNHHQAHAMLRRLRGFGLLEGFRNQAGVDLDRVAEIIVRASELAHDLSEEVAEIDINPIICSADRAIAVDALIVRKPAPGQPAPTRELGD